MQNIELQTADFHKIQQELFKIQEKFIIKTLTNEDIQIMLEIFNTEKRKHYEVKNLLIRLANKL